MPRLLGIQFRTATIGIVGLVSLIAYEAMGNATVMPQAVSDLKGVSLYGFAFGGPLAISLIGMVASGRWADTESPSKSVFLGGICFVGGLLLASMASSMAWMLAGRLVTGLGSGMLAVALYALVGHVYPPALHSRIFAAFSAAWVLPSLLAPGISGTIAQLFGWRWAVVVVAGLAVPSLVLLARLRLKTRSAHAARPQDRHLIWAIVAAFGALALHMLGQAEDHGAAPKVVPVLQAALVVIAVAALYVSARVLLPRGTLLIQPGLPAAVALSGLSQGAFFAAEAFIPLLLHRHRGIALSVAGLALTAGALSWTAGAMYRARVHERVGTTSLLRKGHALLAGGILVSMLAIHPALPFWLAPLGWTFSGAGMGLISPTLSVITLAMAAPGSHGSVGASLRLSAAMTTTTALALSGAAFAALIKQSPSLAFAFSLGVAVVLATTGSLLAGRVAIATGSAQK
ncbi:MFS transporter [Luteimonas sp. 3794]|uniref:MFS transporter n=1 Tax=Luteimonas sp. 3794 TaxID=2817730 RepID=UPI002859BE11|nr:MFS transporter [Luteimonas sp. 3794]MDR6990202.1 MFS family permease [Luteimonas sp. 3794]